MNEQLALQSLIQNSRRIVFFGGAGVSTESGLPDFRSENGIFRAIEAYGHSPEELLSIDFFNAHPDVFFHYYQSQLLCPSAKPNAAHTALAQLEREGKLAAIITQNIDGLHQLAGSQKVFELHGSMLRNYCISCRKRFSLSDIIEIQGIPHCNCGGIIRPDIVMYGERLDDAVVSSAIQHLQEADMLIVGGTSLAVYPAAGLISCFHGKNVVLINKTPTPYDHKASLVIHDAIGSVLGAATFV